MPASLASLASLALLTSWLLLAFAAPLRAQQGVDALVVPGPGYLGLLAIDPGTDEPVVVDDAVHHWRDGRWVTDPHNGSGNVTSSASPLSFLFVDRRNGRLLLADEPPTPSNWVSLRQYRAGVWSSVPMPAQGPRVNSASYVYDEHRDRLLVWDGTEIWEWDGAAWHRPRPALAPAPRRAPALVFDSVRRRTVVFGGFTDLPSLQGHLDVWEWDGATFTATSPMPEGAWTGRGHADFDPAQNRCIVLSTAGLLARGSTGAWEMLDATFEARGTVGFVFDRSRNRPLRYGGVGPGDRYDRQLQAWEGGGWRTLAPANLPDPGIAVTHTRRGITLLVASQVDPRWAPWYHRTELWERRQAGWWQIPTRGHAPTRNDPGVAYDAARDTVVLFGGSLLDDTLRADTWEWNGTGWREVRTTAHPAARELPSLAYDERRRCLILFGGRGTTGALADTWTFDGTTWRPQPASSSPAARLGAAIGGAPGTGVVVLHGGTDDTGTEFGDTWQWDGSRWRLVASGGPATRGLAGMTYDAQRDRLVLANARFVPTGRLSGYFVTETWTWHGARWALDPCRDVLGSGDERSFAYDPQVGRAVHVDDRNRRCAEFGTVAARARIEWIGARCDHPWAVSMQAWPAYAGETLHVDLHAAPNSAVLPTALFFGFDRQSWLGQRLPLDLSPFGVPGCQLHFAPVGHLFACVLQSGAWRIPVPDSPVLHGVHLQDVRYDPTANALGARFGTTLTAVIGGR
jgi:hypothetical protein